MKVAHGIPGRDRYRRYYETELELQAEWLRRCATEKVNSIAELLRRNDISPRTLLELGCGSGAVITECRRRGLAARYVGVEYAPEAADYLRRTSPGIEVVCADITDPAFHLRDAYDLLVVSHVLEHLEEPGRFLQTVRASLGAAHAIVEVPLEDLWAGRLKALVRDRTANRAGHVQFYTVRTVEELLQSHGLRIIDRRTYVPILDLQTVRFLSEKDGLAWHQRWIRTLTGCILPAMLTPLWKRVYYAHHAVLCVADGQAAP